jgi:hypothetical protein
MMHITRKLTGIIRLFVFVDLLLYSCLNDNYSISSHLVCNTAYAPVLLNDFINQIRCKFCDSFNYTHSIWKDVLTIGMQKDSNREF